MQSVIVIGAGAAGLMTALELSKHNIPVTILEAKNRVGGRICTQQSGAFSQPVDTGAEFIHGNLPVTLSLLNNAGIKYSLIKGKMVEVDNGNLKQERRFSKDWSVLLKQMHNLKQDMTLLDFLNTYFNDEKYAELRESAKNFAGGFDLADITTASTKALYREWSEGMENQYRIEGGYKMLTDYLETECKKNDCIIELNCCAKKINWQKNQVHVSTMCSRLFKANKIIVTVPLSVLQTANGTENYIEFTPLIPQHINAAKNIGFGKVIKVVIELIEPLSKKISENVNMIFIEEEVSTWWTQEPAENNILTGWIGGARAVKLMNESDETILNKSLQSLANAFNIPVENLRLNLKASFVANWQNVPDVNGGYSFNTINSAEARKILQQPVNNTLFFAGEALFEGTPCGTVEAALSSAKTVVDHVLKTL